VDTVALPPVVGLYAPVMQSGKTFTATHLTQKHGYRLAKFAGPLKDMLKPLLWELGVDANNCLEGHLKEVVIPGLGVTPRFLLQSLGTEWGRKMVSEDLWVGVAMKKIEASRKCGWPVVVDDLRLPNEYEALAAMPNSLLIKIVRPGETPYSAHGSEGLLEGHTFDYTIINSSSLEWLYRAVEEVLSCGYELGARERGIKEVIIEP